MAPNYMAIPKVPELRTRLLVMIALLGFLILNYARR